MSLHHSMHDRYIRSRNLVYRDIANVVPLFGRIGEKEQVSAIKCGLHGSTDKVRRRFAQLGTGVMSEKLTQRSYLRTTTIGDSVLVKSPRPFQIMRPEAMTDAKFSTCSRIWEYSSIIHGQFIVVLQDKKEGAVHVANPGVAST